MVWVFDHFVGLTLKRVTKGPCDIIEGITWLRERDPGLTFLFVKINYEILMNNKKTKQNTKGVFNHLT